MKKLLGILVVLALLAVPAMGQTVDAERDVKLTIGAYARIQGGDPLTIVLAEGASWAEQQIWFDLVSNVAATITVDITEEASAIGDWSIVPPTVYVPDAVTPGIIHCGVLVKVQNVPPGAPPMTGEKQATVEITIGMT